MSADRISYIDQQRQVDYKIMAIMYLVHQTFIFILCVLLRDLLENSFEF